MLTRRIAERFLPYIDLLSAIDPLLALWMSGAKGPRKFEAIRDDFAKHVEALAWRDDYGELEPEYGYSSFAYTRGQPDCLSYSVQIHAGAYLPSPQKQNDAIFTTQWPGPPDPKAITYHIFKSALLATIEAWGSGGRGGLSTFAVCSHR